MENKEPTNDNVQPEQTEPNTVPNIREDLRDAILNSGHSPEDIIAMLQPEPDSEEPDSEDDDDGEEFDVVSAFMTLKEEIEELKKNQTQRVKPKVKVRKRKTGEIKPIPVRRRDAVPGTI